MSSVSRLLIYFGCIWLFVSCSPDNDTTIHNHEDIKLRELLAVKSPSQSLKYYMLPNANDLDAVPQDPLNPITQQKIRLGKFLFHETGIGTASKYAEGSKTFSCASCHQAGADFQAGIAQGIGEGGMGFGIKGEMRTFNPVYSLDSVDIQPIRTPTIINSAFQTNMLWNGQFGATGVNRDTEEQWTEYTPKAVNHLGYEGLETQAIAGMNVHRLNITKDLLDNLGYLEDFDEVFSGFPEEKRYSQETAGLAIAAYERTVFSNNAPFQRWLRGLDLMSESQLKGAQLFFGKAKCGNCHNGPALNEMSFHALGMNDLDTHEDAHVKNPASPENRGRGGFTANPNDDYKFKVPQLYNLKNIGFLGHGSSFESIREVVEYKNTAIPQNQKVDITKLSPQFVPLSLTNQEIEDLVEFISEALYDPSIERYVPQQLPSGNCFPNADYLSKEQLGCN